MLNPVTRSVAVVGVMVVALIFAGQGRAPNANQAMVGTAAAATTDSFQTTMSVMIDGKLIEGDFRTVGGKGGAIEVLSLGHSIISPRDSASGLPTGKRLHKPFTIVKELDKSSPLLAKAFTQKKVLDVQFSFSRPSKTAPGTREIFYTINLKQAQVAGISLVQEFSGSPPVEEISFVYHTIAVYSAGGIEHTDSWDY